MKPGIEGNFPQPSFSKVYPAFEKKNILMVACTLDITGPLSLFDKYPGFASPHLLNMDILPHSVLKGIFLLLAFTGISNFHLGAIVALIVALLVMFWFVMRHLRFQRKAEEREAHYMALLEAAPTAMVIFQDYKLKYVNGGMIRLTGYSVQQLLSMEIWELIHPQSLNDLNTEDWFIRKNGKGMRLEFQIKTSSGQKVWVDFSAQLIDYQGKPAFLATALNIEDKKQFEARLIEAEERYSLIILATNDGISDYSIETDTLYLSPQWKEMLGFRENEIANNLEAWVELIHAEDRNKAFKMLKKIKEGEIPDLETEYRMRCKDGSYRWILFKLSVVFDSLSKPVRVLGTHSDITQKRNTEEILKESEYRYKSLFSQNSAVMLLTHPDTGAIEDANQAACTYYGYLKEELTGMNISDINQDLPAEAEQQIVQSEKAPRNYQHLRHRLKSGTIRDVEVYSSKIELHGRVLNHFIIYDITRRKRMEVELKEAKEQAESAVMAKSLFISSVSHEIRTPLNAIIGLADLMITEEDIAPGMEENLRSIKFSSDHLLSIINDVLDFSKLEAGKLGIDTTAFNLGQLIKDSINVVKYKAQEKNVNLRVRIHSNVPAVVHSDPSRLKQILLNLLSNSIKFTQEGHIDVYAKVTEQNGENCRIRFAVSDTGIGIPEDKQVNIFESFSQAESNTFRKYGGTGLGLSISKKLTELLEGEIGVKSIEGIGSTFWFEIPMEISELQLAEESGIKPISSEDLSGMRVLLVEDDKMNQFVMSKILKRWNIAMDLAGDGSEAIQKLEQNHYHLVLMDVHMPVMDGYEATRTVRNSGKINAKVPIIALTADITNETRKLVREAGMNDYISKPCEQQELAKKLLKFGIGSREKPQGAAREVVAQPAPSPQKKNAKNHIKQALWDIFDDDIAATKSMIHHFIKQVPEHVNLARTSIDENRLDQACQNLHKVKPGFSYLGFPEVAEQVEKLQELIRSNDNPGSVTRQFTVLEHEIKGIIKLLHEVLLELEPDETKSIG